MDAPTGRFLTIIIFVLSVICTAAITVIVISRTGQSSAGVDRAEVELIIGEYIKEKPEIIVSAFQAFQVKREEEEAKAAESSIRDRKDDLENDPTTPFVGNPKADVTIVKFSDYNCGYCKRVVPTFEKLLEEDKNIKIVMKDFPILGDISMRDSEAAIAAFRISPDKYWAFHVKMMQSGPKNDAQLFDMAEKAGIDKDKLKAEMEKPEVKEKIQKNLALGSEIGVRGTPAFIINGEFIRGAIDIENFREKIAAARAQ